MKELKNIQNYTKTIKNFDIPMEIDGVSLNSFDYPNFAIMPSFCDVHVHYREPGFSYKETIKTGSMAGAKGGYTTVCTMPNLNPVPDCEKHLKAQTDIIKRDAVIEVIPYGSITKGQMGAQLSDMEELKDLVVAFSDDGRGVQNEEQMFLAMQKAKSLNKIIVSHCEVNELLNGGYIHDGIYAKTHNHKGICSESEYKQIERDIKLLEKTKASYHVCHVSTKESVQLIKDAKKSGIDITCETAPHYLVLDESNLIEDGNFKMNPPLRAKEDRLALIEGVIDGTIDMLATDHAPHGEEEKSKGLKGSPFGIVGLETAFSVVYTDLVKKGVITLEKAVELFSINPRKRFNLQFNGFTVWDLEGKYTICSKDFVSMGKNTPFNGKVVNGINYLTVKNNKIVYMK